MDQFKSPESSNIAGARYDPKTRSIEIDFYENKVGQPEKVRTYTGDKFPPKLWEQFKAATSKGTFFGQHIIKDRAKPRFKLIRKKDESTDTTN